MAGLETRLAVLNKQKDAGYWAERIVSELQYLYFVSKVREGSLDSEICKAVDFVESEVARHGGITKQTVEEAESMLGNLGGLAKEYRIICAAHAHIDMNWMWSWDETVQVTLDTFQTMLDLMEEYPGFTFSQSQASVYRIVEEYLPPQLNEIRKRVAEGRWEVTASTWVEGDKNLPNAESMVRHILYTKRYLSTLLGLDPNQLNVDFEPDTFGHSLHVPEILADGGVKYYYHCRGFKGPSLTRWAAPSGREVLAYCEPHWYNARIRPEMALYVPDFCRKHQTDTALKVYGVGDHGGGPTRKDIERILDMASWPLFPKIDFGTLREFFASAERVRDTIPLAKGERNFVFTGCYTSQTRIKTANKVAEAALNEAELFGSLAVPAGGVYRHKMLAEAWKNVLFNQFHDILPGSGTVDTREHAMGLFQQTMASAGVGRKSALRTIADQIDTRPLAIPKDANDTSLGAGAGFGVERFKISQDSRGTGRTRLFHAFNPAFHERDEVVEVILWDWEGDLRNIVCRDEQGQMLPCQVLDEKGKWYWDHTYVRVLVRLLMPACGYRTFVITEAPELAIDLPFPKDPRLDGHQQFVLENEVIRAELDSRSCALISLRDKRTGEELVANLPGGVFRLIQEDDTQGMTAWRVGRHMTVEDLVNNARVVTVRHGSLRQSITYEMSFASSNIEVTVSLDALSPRLVYSVKCDWHEYGRRGKGVPQLSYYLPAAYGCTSYKYDVPMGVIEREPMDMDVPANSFIVGMRKDGGRSQLMLIAGSTNGFRGYGDSLAATLIRSSYDPDPYPEIGIHKFEFAVCPVSNLSNRQLLESAYDFGHPATVLSGRGHSGNMPLANSLAVLDSGSVCVSAVKASEDDDKALVIRVHETDGRAEKVSLSFAWPVKEAYLVDVNEKIVEGRVSVAGSRVCFEIQPYALKSICVRFG